MSEKFKGLLVVASTEADLTEQRVLATCFAWMYNFTKPNLIVTGSTKELTNLAERYKQVMPHTDEVKMSHQLNPQAMEPFSYREAIESLSPLLTDKYKGVLVLAHFAIASDLMRGLHALVSSHYPPMSDNLAMGVDPSGYKYFVSNNGSKKDLIS
jgi:hypothetical protein